MVPLPCAGVVNAPRRLRAGLGASCGPYTGYATQEAPSPARSLLGAFTTPAHGGGTIDPGRRKEDDMRRTFGIGVLLLVILGGIAIGVGAYHAGVNHGLSEAANSRVVHVVEPGYGGGVPFGFLFFPLF